MVAATVFSLKLLNCESVFLNAKFAWRLATPEAKTFHIFRDN